ncbi:MAG TPA: aminotransferase class V-fold PLP-dependent enzyme, partial [Nitrososphaeraceae archaeon]|nr:aminotransferase class V-fold PLP-dependent enzyme [Nitrososphaeraceae archaeon]
SIAPLSLPSIKSIADFLIKYSEQGPDSEDISKYMEKMIEETRLRIKHLINCNAIEVSFTQSTTQGLNFVANSIDWKKGDIIILRGGRHEHYANYFPWLHIAKRKNLKIKILKIDQNGFFDVGELETLAKLKESKLLVLSHVLYNNGSIMPVEEAGKIAKENDLLYCIDSAQSVGCINVDIKKIECDFMAFPSFKWICGPLGIGIFYCSEKSKDTLIPESIGGESGKIISDDSVVHNDIPQKFETGFRNYPGLAGLESSLRYILRIGMSKIISKNLKTSSILRNELLKISGIDIHGIDDEKLRNSIVSFSSSKIESNLLKNKLEKEGIIMAERDLLNGKKIVRASPHFFNNEEEIMKTIRIIKNILQ